MQSLLAFAFFLTLVNSELLQLGVESTVTLQSGANYFVVDVQDAKTPTVYITLKSDYYSEFSVSSSVYYSWGTNVSQSSYTDFVSFYNSKIKLQLNRNGDDSELYFAIYVGYEMDATVVVKKTLQLSTGVRVVLSLISAIIFLVIPSIVGKIIRGSYPNIDTADRYRTTMLSSVGIIMAIVFWLMGTIWMTVGAALITIANTLLWMVILGPIFVALSTLVLGFNVIDVDKQRLKMTRFIGCCIPCRRNYDLNDLSLFHLGMSYGKHGTPIYRMQAKRVDGTILAIETAYSNVNVAERQVIMDKLNAFIPPQNRVVSPPIFTTAVPVVMGVPPQYTPGVMPPQYNEVVYPVQTNNNEASSVTSQYLQELVSSLPPDDQSTIMALFYAKPAVVEGCVRDIKDTDLLRSTLLKLAKQHS